VKRGDLTPDQIEISRVTTFHRNEKKSHKEDYQLKNTTIKAVLWDMDGTLVDTAELHYQAHIQTLAKYGYTIDRPLYNTMFGMDDHLIMSKVAPGMQKEAFNAMVIEKNILYRQLALNEPQNPLPGVVDWLTRFQAWGFRQVVVSTTFIENIQVLANSLQITPYFEEIISTTHMQLPSKPAPDGFLKGAEILSLPVEQCMVIEDAPAGVASAKAAGMKCLAVGTSNPVENLQEADLVTPTMADVNKADVVKLL